MPAKNQPGDIRASGSFDKRRVSTNGRLISKVNERISTLRQKLNESVKTTLRCCSKTGDRIKDGWLCGAEILNGKTSNTQLEANKESIPFGGQETRRREE